MRCSPHVEADLEAYRQANLRHYSGLRFTVLGAFIAISGGLFTFAVGNPVGKPVSAALALFNVTVALACAAVEWRINKIAEFNAEKIE